MGRWVGQKSWGIAEDFFDVCFNLWHSIATVGCLFGAGSHLRLDQSMSTSRTACGAQNTCREHIIFPLELTHKYVAFTSESLGTSQERISYRCQG